MLDSFLFIFVKNYYIYTIITVYKNMHCLFKSLQSSGIEKDGGGSNHSGL